MTTSHPNPVELSIVIIALGTLWALFGWELVVIALVYLFISHWLVH